jgi:hypothetical protein
VRGETFKPGYRVRHKSGWEGWVVDWPGLTVPREGEVAVVRSGFRDIDIYDPSDLTLISDRYEPVDAWWCSKHQYQSDRHREIAAWCDREPLYRRVPPPHQHKFVCECGEEKK